MILKFSLITVFLSTVMASNILMVLPLGSRSHKNIFVPLAKSLTERGHSVTIASLYETLGNRSETYEDAAALDAFEVIKTVTDGFDVFKMREKHGPKNINSQVMKTVIANIGSYCDAFLRDPAIEHVWNTKQDLILLPAFMNECGLAFVHKFKAPFILVTTSGLTPWTADLVGNPEHPAYVPNQYLAYGTEKMNLFQRTFNTIVRVISPVLRQRVIMSRLQAVIQNFFENPNISLENIERNVSLVFVNSHHSMGSPRPLLPNVIEVGGMHCRPAKSLETSDPELDQFMSLGNGSILFSLGSHIKSNQIPKKYLNLLIKVFTQLPYQIVWKYEGPAPKNLPSNVIIRSWLPQQDVLGHKSIKAFFTHGGLLSLQEAVYHGVPMIGLPLMGDQHLNIEQAEGMGIAKLVSFEATSEKEFVRTILEVAQSESYKNKIKERSTILRDQETTPLNRAVYWAEYIIRHRGGDLLKSKATNLSTIEYYLIDVSAIILGAFLTLYFLLKCVFFYIVRVFKIDILYNILKKNIYNIFYSLYRLITRQKKKLE